MLAAASLRAPRAERLPGGAETISRAVRPWPGDDAGCSGAADAVAACVSVVAAADINDLQDAVVAIQTALGPNPAPPPPAFSDSIVYVTWKDDFVGARGT